MSMLTQSFVQSYLSTAFSVPIQYVVPKQGNWFNPQDGGIEGLKVDTWIAFKVRNAKPKTLVYYDYFSQTGQNVSTINMLSRIDVQLVGALAEYGAQSMAHWGHRADLDSILQTNGMALIPGGLGEYTVSDFRQDGDNMVLAYNASFSIHWLSEVVTGQQQVQVINLPSGTQIILNTSGYVNIIN